MTPPTLPNQSPLQSESPPDQSSGPDGQGPRSTGESIETDVRSLLHRMQSGDREAAATFITRYGARVRRRVRGKLGPAMRRLFDSEEILSTVGRRLDLYVRNGRLEAVGEDQLWTLIFKMADNAIVDKLRIMQRLEQVESSDGDFAHHLLSRLKKADRERPEGGEKVIEQALRLTSHDLDRKVLLLWLTGQPQEEIAEELGITTNALSKRWQRIKDRLREHLTEGRTE